MISGFGLPITTPSGIRGGSMPTGFLAVGQIEKTIVVFLLQDSDLL